MKHKIYKYTKKLKGNNGNILYVEVKIELQMGHRYSFIAASLSQVLLKLSCCLRKMFTEYFKATIVYTKKIVLTYESKDEITRGSIARIKLSPRYHL